MGHHTRRPATTNQAAEALVKIRRWEATRTRSELLMIDLQKWGKHSDLKSFYFILVEEVWRQVGERVTDRPTLEGTERDSRIWREVEEPLNFFVALFSRRLIFVVGSILFLKRREHFELHLNCWSHFLLNCAAVNPCRYSLISTDTKLSSTLHFPIKSNTRNFHNELRYVDRRDVSRNSTKDAVGHVLMLWYHTSHALSNSLFRF